MWVAEVPGPLRQGGIFFYSPMNIPREQSACASDALRAEASALGLEVVESAEGLALAPELAARIPSDWAHPRLLVPVLREGAACLLSAHPRAIEDQLQASQLAGVPLPVVVAPEALVLDLLGRTYAAGASVAASSLLDEITSEGASDGPRAGAGPQGGDLLEAASAAPVTRLVNLLLLEAVRQGASDIQFEPFEDRLCVRYRVDGVLRRAATPPKHLELALVSRLKVMAGMDIAERRLPQDGVAQARVGGRPLDIRVSVVPVADGERVVLRLLNRADACLPLRSLGMDEATLESFQRLLRAPNGMVVVSGPTGSGKTTTLYSALGGLDAARRNILTIEDPVEYRLPDIGQIQVKPKIGLTFANGLRHILRQDPDVVLVGETRDAETAGIAVRAALTGHLVFTTLHTNDAPSAVMRLVDMGVQPYLVASCLRGVLGQRLVRRLCAQCREACAWADIAAACASPDLARILEARQAADPSPATLFRAGAGCATCREGYSGRTGVYELMAFSPALREAIRPGNVAADALRRVALSEGMRTMADDAAGKILAGVTDVAEASSALAG
jgi:general secretion pathway protein E